MSLSLIYLILTEKFNSESILSNPVVATLTLTKFEITMSHITKLLSMWLDVNLMKMSVSTKRSIAFCMFYIDHAIMEISSDLRRSCHLEQDTMQLSTLCNFCCSYVFPIIFYKIFDGILMSKVSK